MHLSLVGPGFATTEDDDYGQLFVLNPDNVLSLQDSLTGLLSEFIHRGCVDVTDIQLSAGLADLRLPPMPCYPDTKVGTDALYSKLEEAQYKALAVYLSFSLIYGLLEPSFVASTIQLDAFKRTRQRQENVDCTKYWQQKIHSNLKQSKLDPTVVSFAQQEMLTLYFIYTLVKGPLNEDTIRRAKDEASALFYFENSVQSSFSSVDSEDSSSDMSDDEETRSTHSASTSLSLSSVSSEASRIDVGLTKKRSARHRITGNSPQPTLENKKTRTIKCRFHTKGRCKFEEKCTYAHDDISRPAICPMWGKYRRCDNGKDCLLRHPPHVNDQCNSHKEENKQWTDTHTENSPMSTTTEKLVTHTLHSSIDQAQNFLRLGSLRRDTKETEKDDKPLASIENSKASKKPRHRGRGKPLLDCFKNESPNVAYCHTYMNTNKCDTKDCLYLHYPGEVKQFKRLKLCVDFLNKECPLREDQCRYAHEDVRDVVVCKHWRKGHCNHGRSCRYLHYEPIDEGTGRHVMRSIENQTPRESDGDRFPTLPTQIKELPVKEEEAPATISYAVVARQNPNASLPARPKRKAQCVDENGRAPTGGVIRKPERDENSEDSDHSSLTKSNNPRLHTIKCYWWWNENQVCKFRNCWFAHKDINKVEECHWWLQGKCLKGETCLYRHTTPDEDEAASDDTFDNDLSGSSEMDELPNDEDERSTKKTRKCIRFWYGNGCEREASVCYYAHEDLQHIGACDYWLNDKVCPHGPTCPYRHSETIRALEFEDNPRYQNIFYDPAEDSYNRRTDSEKRYALVAKLRTPPSLDVLPRMNSGCGNIELIYTPEREKAYSYGNKMCQASKLYQQAVDQQDYAKAKKLEQDVRMLARRMKEAHAVASQKIFDICNSDTLGKMKFIDVHGQHIGEAKHHIKQWLDSFHSAEPKVVYIVTGAGRHSKKEAASKGQLRPAIRNYLEQMFVTHETSVYGDDSKGVLAIIFCIHHYTPNHHCMLCPFFVNKK